MRSFESFMYLDQISVSSGQNLNRVPRRKAKLSQCLECEFRTKSKQSPRTTGLVGAWSVSSGQNLSRVPGRQAKSMLGM